MKVLNKNLVATSIAAAIMASAGAAQAATVDEPTSASPVAYAKDIVTEASRAVVDLAGFDVDLGATEALNVDDSITYTLSAGTWVTPPTVADFDAADGGGGAGPSDFALVSGGAGENFATYRVNTSTMDASDFIFATGGVANLTSAADDGTVDIAVSMSGFVGGIATSLFGSPLNHAAVDIVPTFVLTVTSATGTFDVATGYTALTGTGTTSAPATIAVAVDAAATTSGTTATGPVPTATPTVTSTTFTISGPMAGVASIDAATATQIESAVGDSDDEFAIDTATDTATANAEVAAPNTNLTITFDGTTANDISTYTVSADHAANGSYTAHNIGSGTLFSFGRNGSAFTTNSFGPLNRLSISDRSGNLGGAGAADGAINISAWDSDGNMVTCTGLSIPNLTSNSTVVIDGSTIIDACTGAKRIDGNVNSNSILVTNVKTTAEGATATPGLSSGGATSAN